MAVNCLVRPVTTLGLIGVTAMELKVASLTVRAVFPVLPARVAVMVEEPPETPLARPLLAAPLGFRVATAVSLDDQVTREVIFSDVPSL